MKTYIAGSRIIPIHEEKSNLTDEEQAQQDRMLDDMLEDYRMRLHVPDYILNEADRY